MNTVPVLNLWVLIKYSSFRSQFLFRLFLLFFGCYILKWNQTNSAMPCLIHASPDFLILHLSRTFCFSHSILLNGNIYTSWSRSMKIALSIKNKLGFVDGSIWSLQSPMRICSILRIGLIISLFFLFWIWFLRKSHGVFFIANLQWKFGKTLRKGSNRTMDQGFSNSIVN